MAGLRGFMVRVSVPDSTDSGARITWQQQQQERGAGTVNVRPTGALTAYSGCRSRFLNWTQCYITRQTPLRHRRDTNLTAVLSKS
jgi:hypothetical protein